jgi:hypothetical protein
MVTQLRVLVILAGGLLMCCWAAGRIRVLMHQAAIDGQVDPDRLSSTRSLRVIRRQAASGRAALPPEHLAGAVTQAITEILQRLLPSRRLRAFPGTTTSRPFHQPSTHTRT